MIIIFVSRPQSTPIIIIIVMRRPKFWTYSALYSTGNWYSSLYSSSSWQPGSTYSLNSKLHRASVSSLPWLEFIKLQKLAVFSVLFHLPNVTGAITRRNLPNSLSQILNNEKLKSAVWWALVVVVFGNWMPGNVDFALVSHMRLS
jgi:hypothetical protein